jgi:peptidoglycan/LPS O-acetylase OafA/YrhL
MTDRIAPLDGVRAFAAVGVLVAHHNPGPIQDQPGSIYGYIVWFVARLAIGQTAVIAFFALSAFILTLQILERGKVDYWTFQIRRGVRIWPLYYLAIVVALLLPPNIGFVYDAHRTWLWEHAYLYIGFISNWSLAFHGVGTWRDQSSPSLGILWTLAVELQFYLVLPLALSLAGLNSRWRLLVCTVVIITAIGGRALFYALQPDPPVTWNMYYSTISYGDSFLAGAAAAWLWSRHRALTSSVCRDRRFWFVCIAGFTAIYYAMVIPYLGINRGAIIFGYGSIGAFFATLILHVLSRPKGVTASALGSAAPSYLGLLSFGIYVWHVIANGAVNTVFSSQVHPGRAASSTEALFSLIATLSLTIALSAVTYYLVERPTSRFSRQIAHNPAPRGHISAAQRSAQ